MDAHYPIGFSNYPYGESDVMPVKEVAMMILMDTLTDKPDWYIKVFIESIVQKWRAEARRQSETGLWARVMQDKLGGVHPKPRSRIITDAVFDYCIEELRSKAQYYVSSGLIPTLDGPDNTVVKSDSYIKEALRQDLKKAFDVLRREQQDNVDWHPRSNDMVQDLLHPSMYHFVYDRSPFFQEEVVGVENALSYIGQGEPVKRHPPPTLPSHSGYLGNAVGSWRVDPEYWSKKYQWLPSNVGFRADGSAKLTSYVNNLHPTRFPDVYKTLEQAIDKAIPAWDQCLRGIDGYTNNGRRNKVIAGREKSRFEWIHDADDEDDELWTPELNIEEFKNKDIQLGDQELEDLEYDCHDAAENPVEPDEEENKRRHEAGLPPLTPNIDDETMARAKWKKYREAKLPDPLPYVPVDYAPKQSLREKFKEKGLQVIVKMASIELTPEKSVFPAGSWHLEGQMNEKIAATALYYVDSENITSSRLSFRMQTSYYLNDDIHTSQGQFVYAESVYGTLLEGYSGTAGSCNQSYGDVETKEGRLLAFPNVFQHRVSSFQLQDPTKPGHRRFIALWLIDPHRRVISTANVPPQQKHWWVGDSPESEIPKGLMTDEEARDHRLELMGERTADRARNDWESVQYNFCEH
ncbi:hypothetical protein DER45DRAFT_587207 [Fusarium avenaceum]|nr:hypothetical protein DER45DRAFT_587207 [Fusarium avenaceum]